MSDRRARSTSRKRRAQDKPDKEQEASFGHEHEESISQSGDVVDAPKQKTREKKPENGKKQLSDEEDLSDDEEGSSSQSNVDDDEREGRDRKRKGRNGAKPLRRAQPEPLIRASLCSRFLARTLDSIIFFSVSAVLVGVFANPSSAYTSTAFWGKEVSAQELLTAWVLRVNFFSFLISILWTLLRVTSPGKIIMGIAVYQDDNSFTLASRKKLVFREALAYLESFPLLAIVSLICLCCTAHGKFLRDILLGTTVAVVPNKTLIKQHRE